MKDDVTFVIHLDIIAFKALDSYQRFCKLVQTKVNTGSEISVQDQGLIFDQFYHVPNKDIWQYGGTGLGLTLVKKLADMLDVKVDVKSDAQETSFCLIFAQPGSNES